MFERDRGLTRYAPASMIAIVGNPILAIDAAGHRPTGLAAAIATTAAAAGGTVQLIGKVGEDPDGDALLLALAGAGIGHVATLRDPAHRTLVVRADAADPGPVGSSLDDTGDDDDPWRIAPGSLEPGDPGDRPALDAADVELALRYLPDVDVVVVVEPGADLSALVAAETAALGAHLVIVERDTVPSLEFDRLPADALVLGAAADQDPTMFAALVGRYAALVDSGTAPSEAFAAVLGAQAAERAPA